MGQYYRFATPLTARRAALSRRVTMSSVIGLLTLQVSISPPCTCTTTKNVHRFRRTHRKAKVKGKCKGETPPDEGGEKEDLLIQDLCTQGTESNNNMRIVNTDAVSYQSRTLEKCPETAECEKNKK